MGINSLTRWGFLAAALLLVFEVRAASIRIDINTSALGVNGQNWDLAFDLMLVGAVIYVGTFILSSNCDTASSS